MSLRNDLFKTVTRVIACLLALVCVWPLVAEAAQTRLAIIAQTPALAQAVDLLTAEFSKLPEIQVFERSALDKIVREQALALTQASQAITVGQLLGAEAVLFLEPASHGKSGALSMRLVAVKPGVILEIIQSAWPVSDSSAWSARIARQFTSGLRKVAIPQDKLVKISILNLRSPASSAAAQLLDRELTALLLLRLAREPEIIVLERRALASATLEKELLASSERFWTGSHIIDGTINKSGVDPARVTIDAQLGIFGGKGEAIHVEGKRSDLGGVIDELVLRLLKTIDRSSNAQWNTAAEAERYLDEAQWSLRWEMLDEARAAADSAWALGLHSDSAAAARILAYARSASHRDREWQTELIEGAERGWPVPPPETEKIEPLNEGLTFVEDLLVREPDSITNHTIYKAVSEALAISGNLLQNFYFCTEAREGGEEKLATTRKLSREILAKVMAHPEVHKQYWPASPPPDDERELARNLNGNDVFTVAFTYSVFFNEKPEDTIEVYRNLFLSRRPGWVLKSSLGDHQYAVEREFNLPLFGGWRWEDRKRAQQVQDKFTDELGSSTNGFASFFGSALKERYLDTVEQADAQQTAALAGIEKRMHPASNQPPDEARKRMEEMMAKAKARVTTNRVETNRIVPIPRPPRLVPSLIEAELLRVADFLPFPDKFQSRMFPTVAWPVLRNGQIWFRLYCQPVDSHGFHLKPFSTILAASPETGAHLEIPLEPPEFDKQVGPSAIVRFVPKSFEVTTNALYVATGDLLFRRELKKAGWKKFPLPAEGDLYLVHDRLYLSANESIHELTDEGASSRLIASVRRRPAEGLLDERESLDKPVLAPGPDGSLRAFFTDSVWKYEGKEWQKELECAKWARLTSSSGAAFYQIPSDGIREGAYLFAVTPNSREPQLTAYTPDQLGGKPMESPPGTPQWLLPFDPVQDGEPFMMGDSELMLFAPGRGRFAWAARRGEAMSLFAMPRSAPKPVHMEVRFELPRELAKDETTLHGLDSPWIIDTPTHCVIAHIQMSGIFRIPHAEIDRRVQQAIQQYHSTNQSPSVSAPKP